MIGPSPMIPAVEINQALDSIRAHRSKIVQLNALELEVVESWLDAVERELNQKPVDGVELSVCLEVLSRWIGPVEELHSAAEVFEKVRDRARTNRESEGIPSSFVEWFWAAPESRPGSRPAYGVQTD